MLCHPEIAFLEVRWTARLTIQACRKYLGCVTSPYLLDGLALSLLANERFVNVGNNTTSGNCCLDQGVQLLVTSDGQLKKVQKTCLGQVVWLEIIYFSMFTNSILTKVQLQIILHLKFSIRIQYIYRFDLNTRRPKPRFILLPDYYESAIKMV